MSQHVETVTLDNFEARVQNADVPVVVDFWAPWCGPCRAISPVLDELAETYAGRVKVAKVNVDEEPDLAQTFRVTGIPTLVAVRGTKVVSTQVGMSGRGALEQMFEQLATGEDSASTTAA